MSGGDSMTALFVQVFSGLLCPDCRRGLNPVRSPICRCCGMVMAGAPGDDPLCADCLDGPSGFFQARAACVCEGVLLEILHRFKYGGCTELARPLAALLSAAFRRHFPGACIDAVVPVPLHPRRLRSRGFNQAELLVRSWQSLDLPGETPGPLLSHGLVRNRNTPAQAGLGRKERMVNLRGAFLPGPDARLSGRHVLLVDDVYTTGATARECAHVLIDAGAARVDVLTLARAV